MLGCLDLRNQFHRSVQNYLWVVVSTTSALERYALSVKAFGFWLAACPRVCGNCTHRTDNY